MDPIIPKNSHYGNVSNFYCQFKKDATQIELTILEGDEVLANENHILGTLMITEIPIRKSDKCDNLLIQFLIDSNGIVTVACTIVETGKIVQMTYNINSNDYVYTQNKLVEMEMEIAQWYQHEKPIIADILRNQDF